MTKAMQIFSPSNIVKGILQDRLNTHNIEYVCGTYQMLRESSPVIVTKAAITIPAIIVTAKGCN